MIIIIIIMIIIAVNYISSLDINREFQKYISVSIYHCHRGSSLNSLFKAYKTISRINDFI